MILVRGLWFLARIVFGLAIGAVMGLAISDYLIRTTPGLVSLALSPWIG
ncbi:MAG: hypothetical protein AAGF68_08630 [Pseudomonadota bacterium]